MPKTPTYWVRSKQINEITGFGRWPVPAPFKTLKEAKHCRGELHLCRGPYHPGYFIEVVDPPELEDHRLMPGSAWTEAFNRSKSPVGGAMSLAITSRIVSGVVIVDMSGRLCFLEFALCEQINELLEEGHRHFVLNLVNVPYIDSFGLGQLVTIWTSIRSRGGELILLRPTDHVRKLFEITKLTSVFHTSGEEAQAVRSLRLKSAASA